eukprot:5297006-Amphidinium_carterae.2
MKQSWQAGYTLKKLKLPMGHYPVRSCTKTSFMQRIKIHTPSVSVGRTSYSVTWSYVLLAWNHPTFGTLGGYSTL